MQPSSDNSPIRRNREDRSKSHQAGRREQTDRHRQVERGTFLADIRRCQVDRDATGGKFVTGILDCGLDAVLAFLDRTLGETDRGKLRQSLGYIDLHLDRVGVDTEQRPG